MKILITFFAALITSFVMALTAYAQEPSKYNITFPIAELGDCSDVAACRNFCEDPVNQNTCIAFARKKGFYQEPGNASKKDGMMAVAKKELGCDSESSCRSFCSDSANFDRCDAFAKKAGMRGGRIDDPGQGRVLEKAKETLGCSSPDSCASFCSREENRQKCSEFAKETGLRGGEQHVGPGGCNSEATCKAFCSDPQNFQVCRGFVSSAGGNFAGPGGCNSESSCRDYCKSNPDSCRNFAAQSNSGDTYKKYCDENPDKCRQDQGDKREFEKYCLKNPDKCHRMEEEYKERGYNPAEMCSRAPACKWEENTCKCGFYGRPGTEDEKNRAEEYAKFCRENPDKCGPGQRGGFDNKQERRDFEEECRRNPARCMIYDRGGSGSSPAPYSSAAPGGTLNTPVPAPVSGSGGSSGGSYSGTMDPAEGCRRAGGNWNGSYCQMPSNYSGGSSYTPPSNTSGSAPTPAPAQESQPAPAPAQETQPAPAPAAPAPAEPAPAPAVQGINTVRNILDRILDFLR